MALYDYRFCMMLAWQFRSAELPEILLCLHVGRSHQWQRLCWLECQFAVLQSDARAGYVRWPFLRCHSGSGTCRRGAPVFPRVSGRLPTGRRTVCLVFARGHRHHRRADLFTGYGARPHRRTPAPRDRRVQLDQQTGPRTAHCRPSILWSSKLILPFGEREEPFYSGFVNLENFKIPSS